MNVSSVITKYYENKSNWTLGENKPNQSQFQTRSEAEIPTGKLLGILKPGTNFKGKKMLLRLTIIGRTEGGGELNKKTPKRGF